MIHLNSGNQSVRKHRSQGAKPTGQSFARLFVAAAFFLPLTVGVVGQGMTPAIAQSETGDGYATIESAELAEMLPNKAFLLVNVHVPYDGEIEGTDAHIAFNRIGEQLDQLPSDKAANIVVYCLAGGMGEIAAAELSRRGYTGVSNLAGGMIGWKLSGHEIVSK